jgi:hypothetical protein
MHACRAPATAQDPSSALQTAVFALCEEIELDSDSAAVMLRRTAVVIMAQMAPLGFQLPIGQD